MWIAFRLILALLSLPNLVIAATGDPLDLQSRFARYYITAVIHEDGTSIESIKWTETALKETAVDKIKQASVRYSTSAQKAEVVEAYTLKIDGRRIDVPKDNYQIEVNKGKGVDSPVYSDRTTLTVVFPEVSVGDSVVFSYKLTQTEPMFPRQYSTAQYFYNQVAYDDVRIRFEYPRSMWVQYEARGMKESVTTGDDGRKIVEWKYANPQPVKTERRNFSVFDPEKETGYAFSTFRNFADIASAYGERALPKAAVTDRISKLASEIVKDRKNKQDEARALYEWVATNITYAGNCIGIGAVVPRDINFVLDNKMGDCKDHATLLQALLASRQIKSIQALVNAGSVYKLPKIPVVSTVNHVINYLPEFDLFVDSTSDSTPFGMLPYGDEDKPVLLVEGYKNGLKTPGQQSVNNRQEVKTEVKIDADGTATGSVEVYQKGRIATQSRAWARKFTREIEDDFVKNMLLKQGMIGSGKFEKDNPTELLDSYHYKASLNAEKYIKLPGAGAFYIAPPLGFAPPMLGLLQFTLEPEKEADITCSGGTLIEEYSIDLPDAIKVLSVPDDLNISNEYVSYSASYILVGNTLNVMRTLVDMKNGNICSPQYIQEYNKIALKAIDNIKEQVLYK